MLSVLVHTTGKLSSQGVESRVEVVRATLQSIPQILSFTSTTTSQFSREIYSAVSGAIVEINSSQGSMVRYGDKLLSIDRGRYQRQLRGAEAEVMRLSDQQDSIEYLYSAAQRRFREKLRKRREVRRLTEELAEATAKLNSAKYRMKLARAKLLSTDIYAPFTGVVGDYLADSGHYVSLSGGANHLLTLHSIDSLYVPLLIPLNRYLEYVVRDPNRYRLFNDSRLLRDIVLTYSGVEHPHMGQYRSTQRVVVGGVAYVELSVLFANPNHQLSHQQQVAVTAELRHASEVLLLPLEAIDSDGVIYVVGGDGRVYMREVELGQLYGEYREVRRGLRRNDIVLREGGRSLVGRRVSTLNL